MCVSVCVSSTRQTCVFVKYFSIWTVAERAVVAIVAVAAVAILVVGGVGIRYDCSCTHVSCDCSSQGNQLSSLGTNQTFSHHTPSYVRYKVIKPGRRKAGKDLFNIPSLCSSLHTAAVRADIMYKRSHAAYMLPIQYVHVHTNTERERASPRCLCGDYHPTEISRQKSATHS